jgi:hypothetical protein
MYIDECMVFLVMGNHPDFLIAAQYFHKVAEEMVQSPGLEQGQVVGIMRDIKGDHQVREQVGDPDEDGHEEILFKIDHSHPGSHPESQPEHQFDPHFSIGQAGQLMADKIVVHLFFNIIVKMAAPEVRFEFYFFHTGRFFVIGYCPDIPVNAEIIV